MAQDPLRSALLMGGGEPLTVGDLMAASISARLAVLSACDTAIPGQRLPEEVLGLPTGMLAAGAAGVVGSLWSVPDLATRMLVARFYALWRGDGIEPAEALRRAQVWIRDATNGEKWDMLGDMPGLRRAELSDAIVRLWESARAHAHPYYWAAFTFVGA